MTLAKPGSSPRERGAPWQPGWRHGGIGLIPARAGSTSSSRLTARPFRAHPRASGEHSLDAARRPPVEGSSPRERGAPRRVDARGRQRGLIPARAGSTRPRHRASDSSRAHPRASGEHLPWPLPLACFAGSSPRERGALAGPSGDEDVVGLIPARAGSTSQGWRSGSRRRAHPRASGEHRVRTVAVHGVRGSSPRERGAHRSVIGVRVVGGLIPARAGSTCSAPRCRAQGRAHPRASGEHVPVAGRQRAHRGSSPRERGAPLIALGQREHPGLIPARAGSTAWRQPT